MNPMISNLLTVGAVNLVMFPLLAWLMKRFIGKRLDSFDEHREAARIQAEEELREKKVWRDAVEGGLRSILRSELISEHRKAMDDGYYDLQSREYLSRVMHSYHDLNGNDIGDQLYEEISRLPTHPDNHDMDKETKHEQ